MHYFNTPPLKNRNFCKIPTASRIGQKEIKIFEMELQAMKWELGDTEWSKGWGEDIH